MKSSPTSRQRRPHRRKRIVISCTECHRRKQKCDRQSPCCNCIKRAAQDLCHYDTELKGGQATQSSSGESGPSEISSGTNMVHSSCQSAESNTEWSSELQDKIQDFGYSSHGNYNSMNLLRTTELYSGQAPTLSSPPISNQAPFPSDANRRYKEAVRQLPPQACVDILVQTFFSEINWMYDLVDELSFREELAAWRAISYSDLQMALDRLPLKIVVFPALLFQVLAQALLFHSPQDERIRSLITMADMTFHDLGAEYCDTSADLLALLGKKDIALATVQAGVLRASFLKSSGKVVEAWHALGSAIRDAQEIGLHTGRVVPGQSPFSLMGHKVWVVLHIWDVHMAVVLGRPIATTLEIDRFASTIEDDERRRDLFSHWQTETDLPRPFDVILAGYTVAYRYFKDIHQVEQNGASPQDYPIVERIDAAIKENLGLLPSWCRLQNPDTKFDLIQGCQWLPVAREGLASLINLVILALHRPFVFSVPSSRIEAMNAGISILRAQERMFEMTEPRQRKVFNPVYASFDAIVLMAAICLVFPNEDPERQAKCINAVDKGVQRLNIIGQSNAMAASAHGVACSLYHRLRQRFGIETVDDARVSLNNPTWIYPNGYTDIPHGAPSEFSFDALLPPRPTHDLFFDHISSMTQTPFTNTSDSFPLDPFAMDLTNIWNFEGDFSDTSFWNFMNEFNH